MVYEFASFITTILIVGLVYYRLFIYDPWEAANSRIAKLELESLPRFIPYEDRETAIFEAVE